MEENKEEGSKGIRFGREFAVKFFGCKHLPGKRELTEILKKAAVKVGATVLDASAIGHNFSPQGTSVALAVSVLLQESHYFAFGGTHSWPEKGTLILSFYTCGLVDSLEAIHITARELEAERVEGFIIDFDHLTSESICFKPDI